MEHEMDSWQSKKLKIIEYTFILLTIIQNNSVYYIYGNNAQIINCFWLILLSILTFRSIIRIYKKRVNVLPLVKLLILFTLLQSSMLMIEFIFNPFFDKVHYIIVFFVAPLMLLIYFFYQFFLMGDYVHFFLKFRNIVIIIAVMSLFFWILSLLGVPTNSSTIVNWGVNSNINGYWNLHYIAQGNISFLGFSLIRNTGIFVEAPMFSYVLCVALQIELFINPKLNKINCLILLVTIFSTTSTGGMIVSLISLFYYIVLSKKVGIDYFRALICILAFLAVIIVIYYLLTNKYNSDWSSSYNIRMDDYKAGIESWKQHIIFGNGIGNYDSIVKFMNPQRLYASQYINGITGFSNGITMVLAYGGIALLMFYLLPTIFGIKCCKRVAGLSIFSFLLFCIMLVATSYIYIELISYLYICNLYKYHFCGQRSFGYGG